MAAAAAVLSSERAVALRRGLRAAMADVDDGFVAERFLALHGVETRQIGSDTGTPLGVVALVGGYFGINTLGAEDSAPAPNSTAQCENEQERTGRA